MPGPVEQALQDALAFAESVVDTIRDPLLVLDGDLQVVSASRSFYQTFGVARAETEGRLVYELGNRQWDIPRLRTLLEEILPDNTTLRDFEVEHDFEHIGRKVMLLNARRLRRGPGAREMILLAIEDVTQRRDAEEARREAETRFTEMVKNVRDHSIFLTDPDGVVTSWNVAAERIIGYREAEAVGQHFSLIFTPEDIQAGLPEQELRQAREWGRAEDERWHRRKGGERFWALGIVTPLRDATGKLTGYSKILRDMTERKRVEDALRLTEERFRHAMSIGTVGVLFFTLAGRIADANAAFARMSGYTVEELRALTDWSTLTPPEFRDATACAAGELAQRGETAPYEKQMVRKDGSRWWALCAPTRLSGSGRDSECVEFVIDITRAKEAEAALCESRRRLDAALRTARMAVWDWDPATDRVVATDTITDVFGLRPDQTLGSSAFGFTLVHPDDREGHRALVQRAGERGESWHTEFRVIRPRNGQVAWLEERATVTRDAAGGGVRMTGVVWDITDRKHAEAALRESEERFRLMVQSVEDYAIFLMDPDGNVASWNEGAQRILGYAADEIVGKPAARFFTEEDRRSGLPQRELKTAAETGKAIDENWLVSKQGARFWASGATTALRDEAGRLRGYAKILRDLTQRREAEAQLRENEERLRVALAAGQMGTWRWRIPQDEQLLDDSLRRLMGLPPGQGPMRMEEFLKAVHPEDRDRVRAEFVRCRHEGCDLNVEFRVTGPDGSVRWLKDQGKTLTGPDGPFMTGAAVDITERKRMEDELREADRRKDEFLAMLGHELRNPLAPLRSVLEVLHRKPDGHEHAYTIMERQVSHLTRLVDDLLDVSRVTRGLVELRREPVHLASLAGQAVEMAAPAIEGRGQELTLSFPHKPLRVEGDATRLTQVIFNLLHNASKYTDSNGHIWLAVERDKDQAVVRVRDNGGGMPPDLVPRVFDLFTQGARSLDRSQGGLGLGLTLVKRLVALHGGTVEASSPGVGKGSEFVVRLPAFPPEELKPLPQPTGPTPPQAQADRALVIDDNPDVAETMSWMLEGIAREVKMAYSGPAALEVAAEFQPDLILCDLGMPGMDGYETCKRLRQLPGLEQTVIAAVSGYGSEEERRKSQEAGFDTHLVKPVGRTTLEELAHSRAARK